jgi:hypothetical protein
MTNLAKPAAAHEQPGLASYACSSFISRGVIQRPRSPEKLKERCEAKFYVGEWQLLQGDRGAAKQRLEESHRHLPKIIHRIHCCASGIAAARLEAGRARSNGAGATATG